MRALRLVIAAFIVALATPVGAALPQLALACGSATAGQDVACTLTRLSGGRGAYLLFQTSDGTAKAGLDYSAVSKQVYFPAGQQSASIAVHTTINPAATGTLTFNAAVAGGAAVVRAVGSIVEPAPLPPPPPPVPTQTCPDGSVIAATSPCPSIITEPVVSPNGLSGESDIADNFDTSTSFEPDVLGFPPTMTEPGGAFRFPCAPGQLLHDDPIVYPGQAGKSHLHQFFGNDGTNANSTYNSLRTTGGSSCTRTTGTSVQRSAYWMPAMLDGVGDAVKPDFMNTYYKRIQSTDPICAKTSSATVVGHCIGFPNGLRFVWGYSMATGLNGPLDQNSIDSPFMAFDCFSGDLQTILTPTEHSIAAIVATGLCPAGAYLRVGGTFPNCWDGVNLDVADHRSNMKRNVNGICPADHPYYIPEIALNAFFKTDANFVAGKWSLSSDAMVVGAVPGSTLHFDYWEAWSPTVKTLWQNGCIEGHLSCNLGELGNGQEIHGMQQSNTIPTHVLVPLSSIP